jgi:hypothetical protein
MSSKKTKVINQPIPAVEIREEAQPIINEEEDNNKIQAPKKKRVVSQATLDALKKGREALNKKWQEDKVKNKELEEKYAIKKANKIIKQKMNIKKKYDVDENDTEEEDPVIIKQEKKPRKKQIIMMAPESDSEEEIIYKKPSKPRQQQQQPPPAPVPTQPVGRVFFF